MYSVKELSQHFSGLDPVRQKWIYSFFMYPFLSRNTSSGNTSTLGWSVVCQVMLFVFCEGFGHVWSCVVVGCVDPEDSTEDWLMKNFGSFAVMAQVQDFTSINMLFSGVGTLPPASDALLRVIWWHQFNFNTMLMSWKCSEVLPCLVSWRFCTSWVQNRRQSFSFIRRWWAWLTAPSSWCFRVCCPLWCPLRIHGLQITAHSIIRALFHPLHPKTPSDRQERQSNGCRWLNLFQDFNSTGCFTSKVTNICWSIEIFND